MEQPKNTLLYRISQIVSLLLGARIFVLLLFIFALYVSTFFLFNQEENLKQFVFDFRVHGIIFCSILSVAAGGIINQFYDLEKDQLQRPFRTKLQSFLKQKHFLYTYMVLNASSLTIAWFLSNRIFIFFLFYQFLMWFYSHKLSKIVAINNICFVSLTLYPFFGMLVYYQHFSWLLFLMSAFLFIILLIVDIIKDFLTIRPDTIFGYKTLPIILGLKTSSLITCFLLIANAVIAFLIVQETQSSPFLKIYFFSSAIVCTLSTIPILFFRFKKMLGLLNCLRIWIFIGIIFLLLNGIFEKT